MKPARILLWMLVVAAAAGLAFLNLRPKAEHQHQMSDGMEMAPAASVGGPFTLTGGDGRPFPSTRLTGKPYAIFFGFTHCPDVCPTTLARLVKLRRQLGRGNDSLPILFVSVDPERDGPAEVGRYAGLFGGPVVGLTGSPAQIAQVKKQFGIFSEKVGSGQDYSVQHTTSVLLFDKQGKFTSTIAPEEGEPAALAKMKRLTDA
jgi:protein SCO1